MKVSRIAGQTVAFLGGRGGWIINHTFVLGAGGYALAGEQVASHFLLNGRATHLEFGYGGLELEYVFQTHQVVHASAQLLLGGGGANWATRAQDKLDNDSFLVAEPGASLEVNVAKNVRVAAGATYRLVSTVDLLGMSSRNLGGLNAQAVLKVGSF